MCTAYIEDKMKISVFSYGKNLIDSGLAIKETIRQFKKHNLDDISFIDIGSTDDTRRILENEGCNVISANVLGSRNAFSLYKNCYQDNILYFKPYEFFDDRLLVEIKNLVSSGIKNISMYKLCVIQNFQCIHKHPYCVHRIFNKSINLYELNDTTNKTKLKKMFYIHDGLGYIWDMRYNFQNDNCHSNYPHLDIPELENSNLWNRQKSPLNIPKSLYNLVGRKKYG